MALAGRMVGAAGGAEAFASRAVSANVGAAILADAKLLQSGVRSIPVTMMVGGSRLSGTVALDGAGAARVSIGNYQPLRIVRTESRSGVTGKVAEHFDRNGKMVSYTKYSPDELRFDYYVPTGNGGFEPVLYGLRSPRTGEVTLFGPNHRYLGRAVYRMAVRKLAKEAAQTIIDQVNAIDVEVSEDQEYGDFRLCSEMYLLLRQTHFQQRWDTSTPLQFWTSMYADCPYDRAVILPYRETLLNDAVSERNHPVKIQKLDTIIKKFPDFEDAKLIRARVVL